MSTSKFGLALRGSGSKCHREVELMGLGTIPIITPEVTIKSYMDPPVENTHYISASSPNEMSEKLKNITPEKWEEMSKKCCEWYMKNIHS